MVTRRGEAEAEAAAKRRVPLAPAVISLLLQAKGEEGRRSKGAPVTPKRLRPRCGAKTRAGRPCVAPAVWDGDFDRPRNGRCRMHGGLSTGPRTEEGKRRSREAARRGWERRKGITP